MFTSRAEFRLLLRQDNADLRLTPAGRELGLVDDARWSAFRAKRDAVEGGLAWLRGTRVAPGSGPAVALEALLGEALERDASLEQLLRRPAVTLGALEEVLGATPLPAEIAEQVEVQVKYAGYIERQRGEIERLKRQEAIPLPPDLDYEAVAGLSTEVRQKLAEARPDSVGRAARIPGVTPAAISQLLIHLKKRDRLARSA
jgi:tRNA uridine 5-carboxymethylaminomethyl modification enzyme